MCGRTNFKHALGARRELNSSQQAIKCFAFHGCRLNAVGMSDYDPNKKVYSAQGGTFSMIDLLRSFADPELEIDGISRISDLHMKVGEPVRYRYDGDLETIEGGEELTGPVLQELIFPLLSEEQRKSLVDNPRIDIDTGYLWEEAEINFRLNVFHDRDGLTWGAWIRDTGCVD
jgi:hypothetical protein